MAKGYFEIYTNLHRLASESLTSAVKYQAEDQLDKAQEYAEQALNLSANYFEQILSRGILQTIEMERIAFEAMKQYNMRPRVNGDD